MSSPIVLKFGGTSVRDADAMRRVVAITERERNASPVVVTSACAGVTDTLLRIARCCGDGGTGEALALVEDLRTRHLDILADLDPSNDDTCEPALVAMLDEIERLVHGVTLLEELTDRTLDAFASYGERLSSLLLGTAFRTAGWRAAVADSRRFIATDRTFVNARPDMRRIDELTPAELLPLLERNDVVIAQGFIGSTVDGVTTTIGRGGSDHTGALVGAALGAREIQIWTDVSGILTTDPRVVPHAQVVHEVTFTEARELAYFGAKVIHPDTIIPAVERGIPVVIKNSMQPDDPGTRILPDGSPVAPGIHSITTKRGVMLLKLSPRDPRATEMALERALTILREQRIPSYCALLAESRAVIAVDAGAVDDIAMAGLEGTYHVETTEETAILCMIGASLRETPSILAAPLAALDGIPIFFVAAGSSDHIVLLGLRESDAVEALRAIHQRLFEPVAVPVD